MPRRLRHLVRRGVSMLELLIVVAVLGIIGALAVPMFSATDVTRLTGAANVLAADIDVARAESLAHSEDLRMLVFEPDGLTWYLAASSDPTTALNHPDTQQPYTRTLGLRDLKQLAGIRIDSYDLDTAEETNDNKLGFGIYGTTDQTTDPTITLAAGDRRLTLTINANTGEVTIGEVN